METLRQAKWLRLTIQIVGALAILEGAVRLTNLVQAHSAGCNRFELRDASDLVASASLFAAGYGTMLLKNWGRCLLVLCYFFLTLTMAFSFYQVFRIASKEADTLGWVLTPLMFSLPCGLILLLCFGWKKVANSRPLVVSPKLRNFAALSLVVGVGASLIERIDSRDEIVPHPDLDGSFLRRAERRTFYRAIGVRNLRGGRGWRTSIRERDGKIEAYPLPPGGGCVATFDPKTGTLSVHGFVFSGEPYEAAPIMVGRKKLRGLSFSRSTGAISGEITFGEDEQRNLYMFLIDFSVFGKQYDGIYFSPLPATDGRK